MTVYSNGRREQPLLTRPARDIGDAGKDVESLIGNLPVALASCTAMYTVQPRVPAHTPK